MTVESGSYSHGFKVSPRGKEAPCSCVSPFIPPVAQLCIVTIVVWANTLQMEYFSNAIKNMRDMAAFENILYPLVTETILINQEVWEENKEVH